MTKIEVLKGSKQEIAETVARITGEVREVIVFVEEPSEQEPILPDEDLFAEMRPHETRAGGADYSRQALYSRAEGE